MFNMRDFQQDANLNVSYLFNGITVVRPNAPPTDNAAIERIEFLKGAVALHFGSTEPAVVMNFVYKKA